VRWWSVCWTSNEMSDCGTAYSRLVVVPNHWHVHVFYVETCCSFLPIPSARQHPSHGDCLEVKREYYQNCSMLDYRSNRLCLSHWDPYAILRGGCLKLYYCNMVEWFWRDPNLSTTNWFPSVLWHCWFGHLACENRLRNDLWCVECDVKPLHYYYYYYMWLNDI